MRSIGVVTGSRADYGLYVPLFRRISRDPSLELLIYATGTHLLTEFGETVAEIVEQQIRVGPDELIRELGLRCVCARRKEGR